MQDRYNSFNAFLRKKFKGRKIRKIPINAGFPCPNKNGALSGAGCIFCDTFGSGPIKSFELPIADQIQAFIGARERGEVNYIAYYQAHSNTYAPVEVLREKYEIIFAFPQIVGLFIGTRPDAIAPEVYPLLEELNKRTYLTVELGLQSIHARGLRFLNRNHTYAQFLDTFQQLKERNIPVVVHLIIGIPGETPADMLETVKEMNRLKPAGVKFHLLHVLKNTPLFDMYQRGEFKLLEQGAYVDLVVTLLEHLDPGIVIHRLTGERDKEIFYAPQWALDKNEVIRAIRKTMEDRDTFQGKSFNPEPCSEKNLVLY
ncbi:MAG: TIGR01212 family radical SAM protein [Candidatus Aminicenantes bacterium]|nr:TIGR01212 family radical SAM protein [Candidatus Aminicenantes bacterium]